MNSQTLQTQSEQPKYGARVYRLAGKLLVKQTVLRGTTPEYVIDEQRERHVSDGDDAAMQERFVMQFRGGFSMSTPPRPRQLPCGAILC